MFRPLGHRREVGMHHRREAGMHHRREEGATRSEAAANTMEHHRHLAMRLLPVDTRHLHRKEVGMRHRREEAVTRKEAAASTARDNLFNRQWEVLVRGGVFLPR